MYPGWILTLVSSAVRCLSVVTCLFKVALMVCLCKLNLHKRYCNLELICWQLSPGISGPFSIASWVSCSQLLLQHSLACRALVHILFLVGRTLIAFSFTTTVILSDSSTVVLWNPILSFHGICGPQGCQLIAYAGLRLPSRITRLPRQLVLLSSYFKIYRTTNSQ